MIWVDYSWKDGGVDTYCIQGEYRSRGIKRDGVRPCGAYIYILGDDPITDTDVQILVLYICKYCSKVLHPFKGNIVIDPDVYKLDWQLAYSAGYWEGRRYGQV